jgi:hypothetical protein
MKLPISTRFLLSICGLKAWDTYEHLETFGIILSQLFKTSYQVGK